MSRSHAAILNDESNGGLGIVNTSFQWGGLKKGRKERCSFLPFFLRRRGDGLEIVIKAPKSNYGVIHLETETKRLLLKHLNEKARLFSDGMYVKGTGWL